MIKYGELIESIDFYHLLSFARTVHGPYRRKKDGRQIVIIVNDDGTRRTVSYPKHLLEEHLGRILDPDNETVDHLDFNHDNNDLSNLRIVPRAEHSADDTRRVKLIKLKCSMCKKEFERSPRIMRDKAKKGTRGQFCSRNCSGSYSRALQLGKIKKKRRASTSKSEYYRKKNIALETSLYYLIKKYS